MSGSLRRAVGASLAAVGLLAAGSLTADAAGSARQTSPVYEFVGMDEVGHATLTRTRSGVSMRIRTMVSGELTDFGQPLGEHWSRGDATTVWFVVFNKPNRCTDGVCGEDDVLDAVFGDNTAKVGVLRAAGRVAGGSKFRVAGHLSENDSSELLIGMPLKNAMTAEIHLVVRSHGPAKALTGRQLAAALHTVDGGCNVNVCGDPQFAVFTPPV